MKPANKTERVIGVVHQVRFEAPELTVCGRVVDDGKRTLNYSEYRYYVTCERCLRRVDGERPP